VVAADFTFSPAADLRGVVHSSFMMAQQINPVFSSHNLLIASYDLFSAGNSDASGAEFNPQFVAKLEALWGTQSVAASNRVPLGFDGGSTAVKLEGYVPQANESMETQVATVAPNYFLTMQIPMVKGAISRSRAR
jgi:hypothetical protein